MPTNENQLELVAYAREAAVKACHSHGHACIVIPQVFKGRPVTKIMANAFKGNTTIRYILVPETVVTIEDSAFEGASSLEVVTTSIEGHQYSELESASEEELIAIFSKEFRSCLQIQELASRAFFGTKKLQCVELGCSGPLKLGREAFAESGIEVFVAAKAETASLGQGVFSNCDRLLTCYLPSARIETIPREAFLNSKALMSFGCRRFANVGASAFRGCESITNIGTVPSNGLKEVGDRCFEGCDQLDLAQIGRKPTKTKPKKTDDDDDDTSETKERLRRIIREVNEEGKQEAALMEMTEFEFPIFRAVETNEPMSGRRLLRGKFLELVDGIVFKELRSEQILFRCEGSTLPLLRYLAQRSVSAAVQLLDGVCNAIGMNGPGKLDENLIKVLIGRFCGKRIKGTEIVYKADELDTMARVLEPVLPDWVRSAVKRERESMVTLDSEQRKHCNVALRYLLNIEFNEYPLSDLPTVEQARKQLDEAFHGLETVKTQLLAALASMRRTGRFPKAGILLVGEPGCAKTSIAREFGRILGWGTITLDMTSVCENPETITGSSRIFYNGRPGRFADELLMLGSASQGILLANELDQANTGNGRGVMAEVLRSVVDRSGGVFENYLEVCMPIHLLVIATANSLKDISPALRDRFLIIEIPPFSKQDKRKIMTDFTIPKMLDMKNLDSGQVVITEEAVDLLVDAYLLESGARDVEQAVETIVGEVVLLADAGNEQQTYIYDVEEIRRLFGPPKRLEQSFIIHPGEVEFLYMNGRGKPCAGLLEASARPGTGTLTVLGLGDKQKEYVKVAHEAIRAFVGGKLNQVDVTVFSTAANLPDEGENQVGVGSFLSICSALSGTEMPLSNCVCFGAVDLHGSVYHGADPKVLLREAARRGRGVVLAPCGSSAVLDGSCSSINVIEGVDAKILFELAAAQAKITGTPS